MAGNKLYDKGRNKFATGDIHWKATGGDTLKIFLVDLGAYTPDFAADEFASSIPQAARFGNAGGYNDADAPELTLAEPVAGVCDAADVSVLAVPPGVPLEAIAIYKSTGNLATSPLIALIDTATNLPITPVGADIPIIWSNGANKLFKL